MGCVQSKSGHLNVTSSAYRPTSSKPLGLPGPRSDYYRRHGSARGKPPAQRPDGEPTPQVRQEDAKTEEEKEALKVSGVIFNAEENAKRHHTEKYELTQWRTSADGKSVAPLLVVRRGDPFDMLVKFDRPYDSAKDDIKLVFTTGPSPRESKGTLMSLMLSDRDLPRQWGAKLLKTEGNSISVRVYTPPNCQVAKWNFKFDTVVKKTSKVFRYTHKDPFYVLFNPWCTEDKVFMSDQASREEYVLNDKGRVYRGTEKQISAKPWNFGQFEDFILDCVMSLLDKAELSYQARGDAVKVARKISAITNAPDDGGVLVGNWSGDYAGGSSPLAWVGSVAILEQYWKTQQPVKYGQCWVFSAVVVTICRALGLPARSVTNFASAHDCDGSLTIDNYWSADGNAMSDKNEDSVWNFHVWADVWMARPDLPPGYGGWQAIDATPQELSDGVYCAGPASVEAIKNGLVSLPYDSGFIFAEVNADKVHWIQKQEAADWHRIMQKHKIGKKMSTKACGSDERQDVTNAYKFPEETQQERIAVWRAIEEGSTRKDIYEDNSIKNMTFDLIEKEDTKYGEPFDITFKVGNSTGQTLNVKVTLTATVVFYTGVRVRDIKGATYDIKAPANSAGEVTMAVTVEDYIDKVVDMCNIRINAVAVVQQTGEKHCESDDFRLLKPDLDIKVPEEVKVGQDYEVEVSFKNPLPRALTRCEFELEGAGLQKPLKIKHSSIGPHAEGRVTTKLKAKAVGDREIVGGFESRELSDVSGATKFKVIK